MILKPLLTAATIGLALCSCSLCGTGAQDDTDRKIEQLLKEMTLEEKLGQMSQFSCHWSTTGAVMDDNYLDYLRQGRVGSILNGYGVSGLRRLQGAALEGSRLKIPVIFGYDVVHGYKTIFPIPLAQSCTWDPELVRQSAEIAAAEAAAGGINWTFGPMVDISRDPRWGRVMEGAGEDVLLGCAMAKAQVEGFQGKELSSPQTVAACVKHFVGYGASEAGRDYNTVDLSDHNLREIYLPPFKAALDAGAASLMTSFNEIGGVPVTGNKYLLEDILRGEWDFQKVIVSDYTAVGEMVAHGFAADNKQAAEIALNAGVDMDMVTGAYLTHGVELLAQGLISEQQIDNATRRILRLKFDLGLFDDPYRYLDTVRERETLMKPEFMAKAREVAAESAVLLKNRNGLLPLLPENALTVALIGPMAEERLSLNGEWASSGDRRQSVTLLEGLTARYKGTKVHLITANGCALSGDDRSGFAQALAAARSADVVIAAMGEDFNWSGEAASRSDIRLPEIQRELLRQLVETRKPVALVLLNGRPLDLSWEDEHVDAILEGWYPGTTAGDAIADLISGDVNPSGKLTMTFPRNVGQIPIYYNHKNTGRPVDTDRPSVGQDYRSNYIDTENTPLYAFGYGLSYTTFEVSDMKLDKTSFAPGEKITVSATVKNTGSRPGKIAVQLYIRDIVGSVTRPVRELKGFRKIDLASGQSQQVIFEIEEEQIRMLNRDKVWCAEPGEFQVWIAQSSDDSTCSGKFSFH